MYCPCTLKQIPKTQCTERLHYSTSVVFPRDIYSIPFYELSCRCYVYHIMDKIFTSKLVLCVSGSDRRHGEF